MNSLTWQGWDGTGNVVPKWPPGDLSQSEYIDVVLTYWTNQRQLLQAANCSTSIRHRTARCSWVAVDVTGRWPLWSGYRALLEPDGSLPAVHVLGCPDRAYRQDRLVDTALADMAAVAADMAAIVDTAVAAEGSLQEGTWPVVVVGIRLEGTWAPEVEGTRSSPPMPEGTELVLCRKAHTVVAVRWGTVVVVGHHLPGWRKAEDSQTLSSLQ